MKKCNKCEILKPLDSFTKRSSNGEGLRSQCTDCLRVIKNLWWSENGRWNAIKRDFGMGKIEYNVLLEKQGNKCYFCGIDAIEYKNSSGNSLAVDHDHKTLAIRGLLCTTCNLKMGFVDNYRLRIEEYLNTQPLHHNKEKAA